MKKILTAIALSIALPAVAYAQAAPAPKADCGDKMKAGKDCCKDMPAAHAMPSGEASATTHQNHQ